MLKQVIVANRSLRLPPGKLAAQVAHAALGAFLAAPAAPGRAWAGVEPTKVVLRARDADALLALEARAREAGLPVYLVRDAGRTVVPAGTVTCLGIGPACAEALDAVTGDLPLY